MEQHMTFSTLKRVAISVTFAIMATAAQAHDAAGIAHTHDFVQGLARLLTIFAVGATAAAILAGSAMVLTKLAAHVKRTA
jgi:hypothetical protein